MKATFELEAIELELHGGPVAGVDEAGRGPLAGPVVAAAVMLDPDNIPDGIADSKALDAEVRRRSTSTSWPWPASASASPTLTASTPTTSSTPRCGPWPRPCARLECAPKLVLIDGNKAPSLRLPHPHHRAGRRQVPVDRGRLHRRQGDARRHDDRAGPRYPAYGFERHKGYGTPEHQAAIDRATASRRTTAARSGPCSSRSGWYNPFVGAIRLAFELRRGPPP